MEHTRPSLACLAATSVAALALTDVGAGLAAAPSSATGTYNRTTPPREVRRQRGGRLAELRGASRRRLALILLSALLILVVALTGSAWYTTSRLIAVTHVQDDYPLRVLAVGSGRTTVELSDGPDAAEPGTFRLAWPAGHARAGQVVASGPGFVTRQLSQVSGQLTPGEWAGIEPDPYVGDPLTVLGIPFSTVRVPTPLGGMPAWRITGNRSIWVILIHGLGGSRSDTLSVMPALHSLGFPMLAITYRNDIGAPASRDHESHLGATEWHDVESAVTFATSYGATGVVLFAYSMGGAMAAVVAEDSPLRDQVRGLVLDSPVLDWQATLAHLGRSLGLPQPLIALTETLLPLRNGLNYAQFDQLQREESLRAPVLLIQGGADTIVPPVVADAFAHARPDLVTYLRVPLADHVSAIDVDPAGYANALEKFSRALPGHPSAAGTRFGSAYVVR
jgi:pimeloyl-ACP methyl ester carboxylesterase